MNVLAISSQILTLLAVAFWLWMLIDCIRNNALEGSKKLIWLLVILFFQPILGALIYYIARSWQREKVIPSVREDFQGSQQEYQALQQPISALRGSEQQYPNSSSKYEHPQASYPEEFHE